MFSCVNPQISIEYIHRDLWEPGDLLHFWGDGIVRSSGSSIANFLRSLHTVFSSGSTILHSHEQGIFYFNTKLVFCLNYSFCLWHLYQVQSSHKESQRLFCIHKPLNSTVIPVTAPATCEVPTLRELLSWKKMNRLILYTNFLLQNTGRR